MHTPWLDGKFVTIRPGVWAALTGLVMATIAALLSAVVSFLAVPLVIGNFFEVRWPEAGFECEDHTPM